MAKFGIIISDEKVFNGDLISFDFKKSTFTPDDPPSSPISHEFSIDGSSWINVTQKKEVSWVFNTAGSQSIYLRLTSMSGQQTFTKTVQVMDLAGQELFSKDSDLTPYEADIMKWLPAKWSSWNLLHLRAQDYIFNQLREKAVVAQDGATYEVGDLFQTVEVRDWSVSLVLYLIFGEISNDGSDVFQQKAKKYKELANTRSSMARLKLDFNKDSEDNDPQEDMRSVELRRG